MKYSEDEYLALLKAYKSYLASKDSTPAHTNRARSMNFSRRNTFCMRGERAIGGVSRVKG